MSQRLNNLSYLRAVACAAIVLLHVSASEYILYADTLDIFKRYVAMSLFILSYWAVPVFLMISGVFLLDPQRDIPLKKILTKYLRRVLLALIIFGLIYRCFDMIMDGEVLSPGGFLMGFREIYAGTGWSHLWYMYLLIGIYLLLPLFRAFTKSGTDGELKFFLGLMVIFNSLLPMSTILGVESAFYLPISIIYPFYFFWGYSLHFGIIKIKTRLAVALILIGCAGVLYFCRMYCYGLMQSTANLLLYSSIFIIFLSTGIFSLFDRMKNTGGKVFSTCLLSLDRCSFGIYLVHMVIIRYVLRYRGVNLFEGPLVYSLLSLVLMTALTLLVSYLIVFLLKTIPAVKKSGIL